MDKEIQSEIEDYIEKKLKENTLDQTLLFVISLINLLFMLISLYFGIQGVLPLLPLLLSGFFMPFYIGYLRGSLIINTLEEKVRGWIYLIIGCGTYLFAIFLPKISFLIGEKHYLFVIMVVLSVEWILLSSIFISLFIKIIQKIFGKSFNPYFHIAVHDTEQAAICLAIIMVFLYFICIVSSPEEILYGLSFMPGAFYGFVVYEKNARRILEKPEEYFKQMSQRITKKSRIRRICSWFNCKKDKKEIILKEYSKRSKI